MTEAYHNFDRRKPIRPMSIYIFHERYPSRGIILKSGEKTGLESLHRKGKKERVYLYFKRLKEIIVNNYKNV